MAIISSSVAICIARAPSQLEREEWGLIGFCIFQSGCRLRTSRFIAALSIGKLTSSSVLLENRATHAQRLLGINSTKQSKMPALSPIRISLHRLELATARISSCASEGAPAPYLKGVSLCYAAKLPPAIVMSDAINYNVDVVLPSGSHRTSPSWA